MHQTTVYDGVTYHWAVSTGKQEVILAKDYPTARMYYKRCLNQAQYPEFLRNAEQN